MRDQNRVQYTLALSTCKRNIVPVFLLILFIQTASGQQQQVSQQVSFHEIDERIKLVDAATAPELAYMLTKDYTTDREKVRSIFMWIADHIAYRTRKNTITVNGYISRPVVTDTAKWKSANDMVAETVLRNKTAVCDGYARLFKALCDYAGLRSAVISGFAKGDLSRQIKFRCNHTWNAVYIDSSWQLLDITWASGYTSYSGDEFFKRYDETYFLSAPEVFIRDHFPDDLRWTLMEQPIIPREFENAPYRNRSFAKYKINSFAPLSGTIEAAIGDTVQITIETDDLLADGKMAADTVTIFDSSLQVLNGRIAAIEPINTGKNKLQLRYNFYVQNNQVEWLHVLYNHDTILRYRLKIRKEKQPFASTVSLVSFNAFLPGKGLASDK